jgi:teichuronic acid biosynthesis glycosyltransferase TuaC
MEKRLKVLALSYLFPNRNKPDHGIFVLNRLKALSKYVDIKVINPIPWFPGQNLFDRYKHRSDIPLQDIIGGLDVYHPRFFSVPKFLKDGEGDQYLKAIKPIVDEIRKDFEFDLVDMHWTFPDLPAGIAIGKEFNKKTIVTLRGMEAFHEQDNDQRHQIVAKGLKDVGAIIALSQELKDKGDALSGNPNKSVVIRNGVDTDQFYFIPKAESRDHIGMDQSEINILSVGSLIHRKGFDLIVKCVAKLKKDEKYKNIRLYIIGSQGPEGDYRKELHQLIERLDVKENIIFVGQLANPELKYWYNAVNIFCLASRGEGSPNVLSEALACGCPSISTDVGSAKEIIESVLNIGTCVTVDDMDTIYTEIEIKLSPQLYNREANSSNFSLFDWAWCAKKVLPIYSNTPNPSPVK